MNSVLQQLLVALQKKYKAMEQKKRGGARPGAGRPVTGKAKPAMQFRIEADLIDYIKSQGNKSQFINDCIRAVKENEGA